MKALSIRQPWAWLIIHGGKDIENRTWKTNVRGRILVHAAKGMTHDEYDAAMECAIFGGNLAPDALPNYDQLQRGGIIGSVEIIDCVSASKSPWFFGRYGFVLRDSQPLPFHPCSGRLGFFEVQQP
jgi:hypothetical protein